MDCGMNTMATYRNGDYDHCHGVVMIQYGRWYGYHGDLQWLSIESIFPTPHVGSTSGESNQHPVGVITSCLIHADGHSMESTIDNVNEFVPCQSSVFINIGVHTSLPLFCFGRTWRILEIRVAWDYPCHSHEGARHSSDIMENTLRRGILSCWQFHVLFLRLIRLQTMSIQS